MDSKNTLNDLQQLNCNNHWTLSYISLKIWQMNLYFYYVLQV